MFPDFCEPEVSDDEEPAVTKSMIQGAKRARKLSNDFLSDQAQRRTVAEGWKGTLTVSSFAEWTNFVLSSKVPTAG
jgi:hypothetical protein